MLWHDQSVEWVPLTEVVIVVGNVNDDDSTFDSDEDEYEEYHGSDSDESDGFETESEEEGKGGEIGDVGVLTVPTAKLSLTEESKTDELTNISGGGGADDDEDDDSFFCSLPIAPQDHKFLSKVENVTAKVYIAHMHVYIEAKFFTMLI